jgi:DNA modification methylase
MNRLDLSDDDLLVLQKCLNDGTEPPVELSKRLFPSLYSTFDFKMLKDSKIPTIEYAGKRPEAAILNEASAFGGGSPLQLERYFEGGKISKGINQLELFKESQAQPDSNWRNLIVQGDNLQFLKTCYLNQDPIIKDKVKGKVKLFYIDPPFATKADFEGKSGEDSYADKINRAEFIEQLRERLIFARELLEEDGFIFVHLDQRMSHYVRITLTEIFGDENFRNEIILPGRASKNLQQQFEEVSRLNVRHDNLLWFSVRSSSKLPPLWVEKHNKGNPEGHWHHFWSNANRPTMRYELFGITPKTGQWVWKKDRAKIATENYERFLVECGGRSLAEYWRDTGCKLEFIRKDPDDGKPQYWRAPAEDRIGDTVWGGIPVYSNSTGYPTEKNERLLAEIVEFATTPGDLVMDVFGGSGTTAAVSEKLDRRWIVCDFGKHAIYTMQKRMCSIAESQKLGNQRKKKAPYGEAPQPFCVVSVGAFDFQKIMNLRKNRDAYISFVMGIFGLTERDDKLAAKYRVNNICALKEGNPVEIYPVWDDEFLRNVRIDEEYLRGILAQSGGNLKGDYYIIAPETCVRVGETQVKNTRGERVTFKPLTFPYKVLEEVARNFSIEEQPSSPDNINKLISSVGFYFNETVEADIKKTSKGLKISRFTTSILDRNEKRYEGLEGLAMLLIDSDYDEDKGFTVDTVIYQKDINDNEAVAGGLTEKSAVIAIDKHGNESGVIKIR